FVLGWLWSGMGGSPRIAVKARPRGLPMGRACSRISVKSPSPWSSFAVLGRLRHRLGLALAPGFEPLRQLVIAEREHARGEQRRVDRARPPDRKRPDRNAGGHLHDRIERIDA